MSSVAMRWPQRKDSAVTGPRAGTTASVAHVATTPLDVMAPPTAVTGLPRSQASRAHSAPRFFSASSSYSFFSPAVSWSAQRPFLPWLMNTCAPASQKAPASGTLFEACRFIQSKEQYSTIVGHFFSSIGDSEEPSHPAHLPRQVALHVRVVDEHARSAARGCSTRCGCCPSTTRTDSRHRASHSRQYSRTSAGGGPIGGPTRPGVSLSAAYQVAFAFTWWLWKLQTTSRASRPM